MQDQVSVTIQSVCATHDPDRDSVLRLCCFVLLYTVVSLARLELYIL